MDTFENEEYQQTPEEVRETAEQPVPQQPYTNPYHGTGTGRKESPYANSPHETTQPPPPSPPPPKPISPPGRNTATTPRQNLP